MNHLLRLYPRAWRDRYLDEVSDLLAERPPSVRDRLDLIAGAVDARIHPQVANQTPEETVPILRPLAGSALALLGGLLWAVGGIVQATAPYGVEGYKESTGVLIVASATLVTALAAIGRAWSGEASPTVRRCATAMLGFALLMFAPWPIVAIGFYGHVFSTAAFGLVLARSRQLAGLVLAIGAFVATSFNTENTMAFATVPLGLAWVAVGITMVSRRSAAPAPAGT